MNSFVTSKCLVLLFCLFVGNFVFCQRAGWTKPEWNAPYFGGSNGMVRNLARFSQHQQGQILFGHNMIENSSFVNVLEFGAKGDGKTDDTTAFQDAIHSLSSQYGGGIVYAPTGQYKFAGSLVIPIGVTLEGTYRCVPSHAVGENPKDKPTQGTVLLPYGGKGNENGTPFLTIQEDATLRGVVIYYPEQVADASPTPFPWTIDMKGDNPAVMDVECLNCYNAIRAVGAGRHYVARVQGQPINTGIYIDETYDIGRVEDVHFNPWFSQDKTFLRWQLLFGRAFVIARSDWEYFFNTFAFGYSIGYHFIKSQSGACNGNFLGIGADMAANASVLVEAADPWGILITNGEFTSFVDPKFGVQYADSTQVVVEASNIGSVRFVNSAFWGPSNHIAKIDGKGTVGFGDCTFSSWDAKKEGDFAIDVQGTGSVLIRGCDFQKDGNQINLGYGVERAVIVGNLIKGAERIIDKGVKNIQKGLNAAV